MKGRGRRFTSEWRGGGGRGGGEVSERVCTLVQPRAAKLNNRRFSPSENAGKLASVRSVLF